MSAPARQRRHCKAVHEVDGALPATEPGHLVHRLDEDDILKESTPCSGLAFSVSAPSTCRLNRALWRHDRTRPLTRRLHSMGVRAGPIPRSNLNRSRHGRLDASQDSSGRKKSSTGPLSERDRAPNREFLSRLTAPARRALEREGIKTVRNLSRCTKRQILRLHRMGPSTLPRLKQALQEAGLTFKA
jgi:hypothetical protein